MHNLCSCEIKAWKIQAWTDLCDTGTVLYQLSCKANRPGSIYQYSNMAQRLSGQTSTFGVVFFVLSLFWELRDKRNLRNCNFDPKDSEPCMIYRAWPIGSWSLCELVPSTNYEPARSCLDSSVGKALHRYRRACSGLNFFSLNCHDCLSCLHNCDDQLYLCYIFLSLT